MPDSTPGVVTAAEIAQQPDIWPTTLDIVSVAEVQPFISGRQPIICGAGTSAYAASVTALGWSGAWSIPTTDLLLLSRKELRKCVPFIESNALVVSLARSGDSPESIGVVSRLQRMFPQLPHMAITCSRNGRLANMQGMHVIILDPRTNDQGLAMTGSFSNLALAGLSLKNHARLSAVVPSIADNVKQSLPILQSAAKELASGNLSRFVVLTPPDMKALGQEASLKVLEMTAGRVVSLAETFLGLRHGPMSFLTPDTLLLCILSSDPAKREYENDLIRELRDKNLGKLVIVGDSNTSEALTLPAMAGELPDYLRTPFEIVFPQLLAFHLSKALGLDPDNPSPSGIITRVVQRFKLHDDA
jgi:tagatose-6-phosphate ketose/aldose isomerase